MKNKNIPFNSASTVGNELSYIQDAINKKHISGAINKAPDLLIISK